MPFPLVQPPFSSLTFFRLSSSQVNNQSILSSRSYLREHGKPVIVIWGLGFAGRGHNPRTLIKFIQDLRASVEGGLWIMAGTPSESRSPLAPQLPFCFR